MNEQNKLDKTVESLKNHPIPQGPSAELIEDTLAQIETTLHQEEQTTIKIPTPWHTFAKRAIAAIILIGIGFSMGHWNRATELNEQQLQALQESLLTSLQPRLASQLKQDWQRDLIFTYGKVMQEVNTEMQQYAVQALTASQLKTAETFNDLAAVLRKREAQSQAYLSGILNQLEQNQTDLVHFADWTQNRFQQNEEFLSHIALDPGSIQEPNQPSDKKQLD